MILIHWINCLLSGVWCVCYGCVLFIKNDVDDSCRLELIIVCVVLGRGDCYIVAITMTVNSVNHRANSNTSVVVMK